MFKVVNHYMLVIHYVYKMEEIKKFHSEKLRLTCLSSVSEDKATLLFF